MPVVVDTNIFINAIYEGDPHSQRLLRLIDSGQIKMLASEACAIECASNVAAHAITRGVPANKVRPAMEKVIRLYFRAELVNAPGTYKGCIDPDDDKFFDLAIAGGASYIISMDSDLTTGEPPVPVLAPWQYLLQEHSSLGRAGKVR